MAKIFVTGISTDVGKTIASAILVEALEADYWKPIQAGSLEHTDTQTVRGLISNSRSRFHDSSYSLRTPMSPHAASEIDGLTINLKDINIPKTANHLIIEGAGGLLVPLNEKDTVIDLIKDNYKVVIVSRHYLGSINHTLLTIDKLKQKNNDLFIIYSGQSHPSTEDIINNMSGITVLGRIDEEPYFDNNVVSEYAQNFEQALKILL